MSNKTTLLDYERSRRKRDATYREARRNGGIFRQSGKSQHRQLVRQILARPAKRRRRHVPGLPARFDTARCRGVSEERPPAIVEPQRRDFDTARTALQRDPQQSGNGVGIRGQQRQCLDSVPARRENAAPRAITIDAFETALHRSCGGQARNSCPRAQCLRQPFAVRQNTRSEDK